MISSGAAIATPLPETPVSQFGSREAASDPVASTMETPVQSAARDLTGVKDEARLPIEPEEQPPHEARLAAMGKPSLRVDPKPVPEISRAEFCSALVASAEQHNVPVELFANLIWQESRFRPQAVSPVGALGVAQFMPRVAEEVGLKNPFNPLEALPAAARFFAGLVERFGSLGLATAAYNAGSGRVGNWLNKKIKQLPQETQKYVRVITGRPVDHWRSARHGDIELAASIPCRKEPVFAKFNQADLPEQRQVAEQQEKGIPAVRRALGKTQQATAMAKARSIVNNARTATAIKAKVIKVSAKPRAASKHAAVPARGKKAASASSARTRPITERLKTRIKVAVGR